MADVFGAIGNAVAAPVKILGAVRNAYYDPQGTKQRAMEQSIEANDIEIGRAKMQAVGEYIKQYVAPSDLPKAMNDLVPMLQQDPQILKAVPQLKNLKIKTDFGPDVDKAKRQAALGNIMGTSKEYAEGNIGPQVASQAIGSNVIDAGFGPADPMSLLPGQKYQFAPRSFSPKEVMIQDPQTKKFSVETYDENKNLLSTREATEKEIKSGSTNINVDMGVSKTTASQIEQKQLDLLNSRDALKNSMDKFEGSFATWYGKGAAKGVAIGEKIGLDKAIEMFGGDTAKAKQYLSDFTAWDSSVRTQFNEYRKYITGAAAGMPEIEYLKGATISDKDSKTQIASKTKELLEMGQRVMNRNKIFMAMGLNSPADTVSIPSSALPADYDLTDEQAKQLYEKYSKGKQNDIPSEKLNKLDPESRAQYEQILKSGDSAKIKAANDRINAMK